MSLEMILAGFYQSIREWRWVYNVNQLDAGTLSAHVRY